MMGDAKAMAERARVVLSVSSHSEHETDTELEMKTRRNSGGGGRTRRSNSENRCDRELAARSARLFRSRLCALQQQPAVAVLAATLRTLYIVVMLRAVRA